MFHLRRVAVAVILIIVAYFGLTALHQHLDPNKHKPDELREDAQWIATSKHWLDRQACRWLGLCGLAHYHPDPAARSWMNNKAGELREQEEEFMKPINWEDIVGSNAPMVPGDWEGDERVLKEVPQFVLDHAPLVHLYSKEEFWPSNIVEHLQHVTPYLNTTSMHMPNNSQHNVNNLHELNGDYLGRELFMQSRDDVEKRPGWLGSAQNKPIPYPPDEDDDEEEDEEEEETVTEFTDEHSSEYEKEDWFDTNSAWMDPYKKEPEQPPKQAAPFEPTFRVQRQGQRPQRRKRRSPALPAPGGYSPAPAILVVVDKGNGITDAFWFYFYSYNLGTTVLNIRFGNHVGDWEHSLIRFHNGIPKAVFFSAHSGGLAYSYNAVEKGKGEGREGRPVLYSAFGSHAMYATPGKHPYVLPFGLLADVTDRGPLWDPAQNYLAYHYNTSITHHQDAKSLFSHHDAGILSPDAMRDILQPAACNPQAPMGWWWYKGHWGDKFYELGDERQWRFVGEFHYVNGPYGPRYKNLGRSKPCQSGAGCTILESIEAGKGKSWITRRKR